MADTITKSVATTLAGTTTYITIRKYEDVALLIVAGFTTSAAKGWNEIGYVPDSCKPTKSFYFPLFRTNTDDGTAWGQLLTNGKVQVYNPNTTANIISGSYTYVI